MSAPAIRISAAGLQSATRLRASAWAGATLPLPVLLWCLALRDIDLDTIGRHGLAASLPAAWYAALALALAGSLRAALSKRLSPALAALHIALVVLIVYATVPAAADMPQYAWTYKHAGVAASIGQAGAVGTPVDIYHHWPAFFSLAAAFSRLGGVADPLQYAAWAEPFFALLSTLVVAAVARAISRDARSSCLAALFFAMTGWVAQSYFAPQPLAFLLGMTLMLVILRNLTGLARTPWLVKVLTGRVPEHRPGRWSTRSTCAVVVALQAVVVITHQLTPFMLLLLLLPLAAVGMLRPRRLLLPLGLLPVAYLLFRVDYLREHHTLFTGLDPERNWRAAAQSSTEPWIVAHAGGLLSGLLGMLAVGSVVTLLVRRAGPWPLLTLALALSPLLTVFGMAYGGEASLRVHYFAAPWLAVLAGWGIGTCRVARTRIIVAGVALCAISGLFLIAFYARTAVNVKSPAEVAAAQHFYERAEPESVLTLVNPGFPMRLSARYPLMRPVEGGDNSPNLMSRQNEALVRAGDVDAVMVTLRQVGGADAGRRYLVFSDSQARYAALNRILTPAQTRRLEAAVASSGRFRLWHRTGAARIYEAVSP